MVDHMSEKASIGIQTYSNYAHALCIYPETKCGLENEQNKLPAFQALSPSSPIQMGELERHLKRGFMTLEYMQMIPIEEMPDFGMKAAFWLPAQAYYAVYGFGLAAIAAFLDNNPLPKTHSKFISCAGEMLVKKFLPDPFSARISGGYWKCRFMDPVLDGLDFDFNQSSQPGNLQVPTLSTRAVHIVRCLSTTRERNLEKYFDKTRKNMRKTDAKANLDKETKKRKAKNTKATTAFDYFYRIRLRSNYEYDAGMFDFGTKDGKLANNFVMNNQKMTTRLCYLLLRIIEHRLSKDVYEQLLERCQGRVKWKL